MGKGAELQMDQHNMGVLQTGMLSLPRQATSGLSETPTEGLI